jgi:hypothetical protein
MKSVYYTLFILLVSSAGFAQDSTWKKSADSNTVIIHKDPRIDLLIKKQIQINEESSRDARRIAKGYRLLVVNTPNREEAVAVKTKLYSLFPELKTYLIYQSPYFKLKAGNFKDRKEAEAYQNKMKKHFPKGVFIMNDTIEIKTDKDTESL